MIDNNRVEEEMYYCAYQMLLHALESNNLLQGAAESLSLAKIFLKAEDIIVYKLVDDDYNYLMHQTEDNNNEKSSIKKIEKILNRLKPMMIDEDKLEVYTMLNDKKMDIIFQPIFFKDLHYVLTITNHNNKEHCEKFLTALNHCFKVVLEKYILINELTIRGNKDSLTNLNNRHPFKEKLREITNSSKNYTFVLFDLLRLKSINDLYGHDVGDLYIKNTADILAAYFPKYALNRDENGTIRNLPTESYIYRIGGDEFALISSEEKEKIIKAKIELLTEDIKNMDLGIMKDLNIGINYGISTRDNFESGEELYKIADENLRLDKKKSYKELQKIGIVRRK